MLNVKSLTLSLAFAAAITFVLCVLYGLIVPPEFHAGELLEKILPGFRWLTFGGFLIGLGETFVYGAYTGLMVGWLYNALQRRTAAA
jgi:hypothetical protein